MGYMGDFGKAWAVFGEEEEKKASELTEQSSQSLGVCVYGVGGVLRDGNAFAACKLHSGISGTLCVYDDVVVGCTVCSVIYPGKYPGLFDSLWDI